MMMGVKKEKGVKDSNWHVPKRLSRMGETSDVEIGWKQFDWISARKHVPFGSTRRASVLL